MNITLRPTPQAIPTSNCNTKQAIKVPTPGIKSDSITNNDNRVKNQIGPCEDRYKNKKGEKRKKKKEKSSLFVLHMGLTTFTSTMKMTAAIIIAAKVAFGIKEKYGVRKNKANTTKKPEEEKIITLLYHYIA
jgi:hypothetical protein